MPLTSLICLKPDPAVTLVFKFSILIIQIRVREISLNIFDIDVVAMKAPMMWFAVEVV